jgi:hypothetical protein
MEERERRIRERAFEIWIKEGCPKDREIENWRQAEREVAMSEAGQAEEGEDLESARDYDRKVKEFEDNGRVPAAAREAVRAVDSPENEELQRAERAGKSRAKGFDAGGKK